MFVRRSHRWLLSTCGWLLAIAALIGSLSGTPLRADEPFQEFLDSLRERQYFDAAMDYLSQMKKSGLVGQEIKAIIPYEEARTLIEDARAEKDGKQKGIKLDAAKTVLDEFVKGNSAHPITPNARMQLGNVIVERGRMVAELSGRPSQAGNKAALSKQARDLFDEALKVFNAADENFKTVMDGFPKFIPPTDKALIEKRDQARRDFIQAQLFAAATLYEKAKTYDEKDKAQLAEFKKALQEAADKYEKIYQAFRTRLAGLLARIKQGQCYQEMGDTRRALGYYSDILGQPDELPEFRKLKASALYLTLQCWNADTEKKYELAHTKGEDWLRTGRGLEDRQADWLAIRYYTAQAYLLQAKTLDPELKFEGANGGKAKNLIVSVKEHATKVAKIDGPYQDPAKVLLSQVDKGKDANKEPANFVEASERGKLELDGMTEKQVAAKDASESAMAAEKAKVPELIKEAAEHRANAVKFFQLALSLRGSDDQQDEVTNCRYYLCYMHYLNKEYYDAAVMGEFIARNYPGNGGARQSAKIALACYLNEYQDPNAPEEMRSYDRDRMLKIAEFCSSRWPSEEETIDNWAILTGVAVKEHDMKSATAYLAKIPEESPRRAESELKLGQAFWTEYLLGGQKDEADRPTQDDLNKLRDEAIKWLETGMNRMKANLDAGGELTLDLVAAALSGSQIYVAAGSPAKGLELLENDKFGPLKLIEANNPLVQLHEIPRETYKVALRAYVATSKIDRAKAMMEGLKKTVTAGNAADLTKIFISMGRALEEQVNGLRASGNAAALKETTEGFKVFLEEIAKSEDGNTFSSLNWVAETYYSLGAGFDVPGVKLPEEAKGYFDQTLDADKKLLVRKDIPSPDALINVKLRTARAMRRLNRYKEAIDLLTEVLKEKAQLLDAQTEAAYAYMDWGAAENPLYYNLAMFGARKAPNPMTKREENVIWGWVKMANVLNTNPQFEKNFHEARVNTARCHLLQSEAANAENKLDKKKLLEDAYQDIRYTTRMKDFHRIQKDLPDVFTKYDDVLKTIQKSRGEKVSGMRALLEATKPATAAPALKAEAPVSSGS